VETLDRWDSPNLEIRHR